MGFGLQQNRRLRGLVLLLLGVVLLAGLGRRWLETSSDDETASGVTQGGAVPAHSGLEARERRIAETVWAKELLAQESGRLVESLWDSLNRASNKLEVLADLPVAEIVWGRWPAPRQLPHGIKRFESQGPGLTLDRAAWRRELDRARGAGWELAQTEFRHRRFEVDDAGLPRQSRFSFSAHLTNPLRQERAILAGDLVMDWRSASTSRVAAAVARVDASRLTITTRMGAPFFQPILTQDLAPEDRAYFIDPLILHDLDGDGLSEIILGVKNLVYRREGPGRYAPQALCRHPPGLIFTAILADFSGDGRSDFLCARWEGLFLFKGSRGGAFDEPGRLVWLASEPLKNPMALTCGDIDGDGDLDLFLGQYRVPFLSQNFRPHYYDANDGYPAYLLRNEGQGDFTDVTVASGLEAKRWRRTFSASLVDLDEDRDLDLLVVSDFAGLDLYANDGAGRFTSVTGDRVAETRGFGMSHTFADFNADGLLDVLMVGMDSPTVDRLEHLGLVRPDVTEDRSMRQRMAFGNRLYLGRPGGLFQQTALNDAIAKTGWSWGSSPLDFDNDGFPDLYISNGHQSKASVRDYEPEFWLHDLYVEDAVSEAESTAYFMDKYARTRGQGWSYGGYDKNRLFLNQQGVSFLEIGHLAGVALEEDSRNVVADDLDGDGGMDLLVTTFEAWPQAKQSLRVYRNTLRERGNWLGVRFAPEDRTSSPIGTRITVQGAGIQGLRQIVTGDGFRSQSAPAAHFGLGRVDRVERVDVRWLDGRELTLRDPALNQVHTLRARPAEPPRD